MADDVSCKLPSILASLTSSIHEEHEDEDGLSFRGKDLLSAIKITLAIVDSVVHEKGDEYIKDLPETWSQFIPALGKLVSESDSSEHLRQQFEAILTNNKDALCSLLTCFARKNDQQWVCKLKEFTNFEVRYLYSRFMFPAVSGGELAIEVDRSNILEESFRQIMSTNPERFLGDLSLFFKHEEAYGDGVLRQWMFLVCDELFDPKRKLFILSPDDKRRISPNPLSAATENHLEYFRFAGRMIALSLKSNIQTGILFDFIFFKVLSGSAVLWEDLSERDYQTYLYYNRLSAVDPEEFDNSDGCGLVFSVDVPEISGKLRSHPLLENGEDVAVTSTNRETFLQLLFQHNCVTRVRDQTLSFSQGFEDMLSQGTSTSLFFSSIQLKDLDSMLRGSEQEMICPYQWRAHTSHVGFGENDDEVINWFWQVVEEMTNEQRRRLLFFWAAVRYLPRNGFQGLPDQLTIRKTMKNPRSFPKASTCSYQITIPRYPSYEITATKVLYIVHEGVFSSFGRL